jgi:hypothetical protein
MFSSTAAAAGWEQTVTGSGRGEFPNPRPFAATYAFGWGGFTAATADIRSSKPAEGRIELQGTGGTIGTAQALWKFDTRHRALADANTLRPLEMEQVDLVRAKTLTTKLAFNDAGVVRTLSDSTSAAPGKSKRFDSPNLFDLHTALLYLRSQRLQEGSVQRLVVYPATAAYLATITVLGRESVKVAAGTYPAIKCDLQLNKIGKKNELQPHKKFSRATVWLSDDGDRLLLRIEARVFIGVVFVELQSVAFQEPKK